jgi:hypothetical protein
MVREMRPSAGVRCQTGRQAFVGAIHQINRDSRLRNWCRAIGAGLRLDPPSTQKA